MFYGKLDGYVLLNNRIPNFVIFFCRYRDDIVHNFVCISSVDSSPAKFPFLIRTFVDEARLPEKKKIMPSVICRFHLRLNPGIIAGNRDPVNKSES